MQRLSLLILAALSWSASSWAIPAYPYPVKIGLSGNDSVRIIMQGDEFQKYAIMADGNYSVMRDNEGQWRYLERSADGNVKLSAYKLTSRPDKTVSEFLSQTPIRLIPDNNLQTTAHKSAYRNSESAVTGSRRALIILAQFTDLEFKHESENFNRLFNEHGYSEFGATGSVKDYFNEISEGQLDMTATVIGPFTTSHPMKYYGKNSPNGGDSNPWMLFSEALSFAKKTVALDEFDCNGDGEIDNIHIIYAGYGEEAGGPADAIWAHESSFNPQPVKPGLSVDRYSCSPELRGNSGSIITTIGPSCHEICHALGAMDFYDTDYDANGLYNGTGVWDVMANGSWNNEGNTPAWPNPYVRAYDFHWTEPTVLEKGGNYNICNDSPRQIYRVNTTEDNDYFLLDFHDHQSFMSAEPSGGLMIFHIGPDIESRRQSNTINNTFPQQCYPVCASSTYSYPTKALRSYGDINSPECPFPGAGGDDAFDQSSVPGAFTITGKDAGFSIRCIKWNKDEGISFVFNNEEDTATGTIWKESFESDQNLRNWTATYLNGTVSWARQSAFDGVPDGKSFVVFKPQAGTINPLRIATKMVSSPFRVLQNNSSPQLSPEQWIFSLWCKNRYKTASEIELSLLSNDEVLHSAVFTIPTSNEWNSYSYEIDNALSEYNDLRVSILIKADIINGRGLWLDNISLSQVNPTENVAVDKIYFSNQKNWKIYTITGLYIGEINLPEKELPNNSNLSVQKGLYLCVSDSDVIKVLKR